MNCSKCTDYQFCTASIISGARLEDVLEDIKRFCRENHPDQYYSKYPEGKEN